MYRATNVDGQLPPVVLFRTWENERPQIDRLVELIGADLPIYELSPPENAPDLTSVAAWVATQRQALAQLPIEAPYRFIGWSFGGLVALELAHQLRQEGIEVEHVGLIDVGFPLCRSVVQLIGQHARQVRQLGRGDRWSYASSTARRIPHEAVRRVKESRRRERARQAGTNPRINAEDPGLRQATDASYFTFRPHVYNERVTLYISSATIESRCRDASTGWAPWMPSLEIVTLPGNHFKIWDPPHNAVLADALLATAHTRSTAHA